MFQSETLFIVGAGASQEAGLPIGSELTQQIADLVNFEVSHREIKRGDPQIYQTLVEMTREPEWKGNRFLGSGRGLAEAMDLAPSIDTFLETHRDNPEFVTLGKLGIVKAIAAAERNCRMAPRGEWGEKGFDVRDLSDTWYRSLAHQLFTGVDAGQPEQAFANTRFIVFNYDRCLQTYLTRAVEQYFQVPASRAQEVMGQVEFLHPYGSLGRDVPFAPKSINLRAAAEGIKTYSETVDSAITDLIRQRFYAAETIIFLGFAFHPANMQLLEPQLHEDIDSVVYKRVFATTYGLSPSDEEVVKGQIAAMIAGKAAISDWIKTNNGKCKDLFSSYWRSLTA